MPGFLRLLYWTVSRLGRAPAAWAVGLLMLGGWALLIVVSPIGLSTGTAGTTGPFYELAFLSALAGTALAFGPLQDCGWLLGRTGPGKRLVLRFSMLLTGGTMGLAIGALVPATLFLSGAVLTPTFALAAVAGLLHLAGLGLVLVRTPVPNTLRPLALAALAWLLPRVVGPANSILQAAAGLLDVSRHWNPASSASLPNLAGSAAAITALALAAWLLEVPARNRDRGDHPGSNEPGTLTAR